MKKTIFLILTLAIPVSIFLFLKIFGNNEFEVPVFFEEGIPDCANSSKPHQVPLEQLSSTNGTIGAESLDGYLIFGSLSEDDSLNLNNQIIQLVRIQDAFYEIGAPTFVFLGGDETNETVIRRKLEETGLNSENYLIGFMNVEDRTDFMKCGLGLSDLDENGKLVLVDPDRRVRGNYDGLDIDQTEQLILELKILRKQEE